MRTITVQVGNSDNKLTQAQWADFVQEVWDIISKYSGQQHFFGGSVTWAKWQNVAWIIEYDMSNVLAMRDALSEVGKKYDQDSIAYTEGETLFI